MSEAEQFIAELKALEAEQEKRAKEGERGLSDETKKKLEALPTNYGFTAQVESQHCIFYVNDIPLYSTLDDYPDAPKSPTTFAFSFGYAVGSVMENGINEIKIRVIGDIKNPDAHQQFCYFELSGEKTGILSQNISEIVAFYYDKLGHVSSQESVVFEGRDPIEKNIQTMILEESLLYEDKNIKDRLFTRKVVATNLPEFSWTKATPYTDTPANRKALIEAYENIRYLLNKKDLEGVKAKYRRALTEQAELENSSFDYFFKSLSLNEALNSKKIKLNAINYQDYEVLSYNSGRMIRLVHKDYINFLPHKKDSSYGSPITYEYTDERDVEKEATFNPYFSLINGRFEISR